jgi:hypothetical protein
MANDLQSRHSLPGPTIDWSWENFLVYENWSPFANNRIPVESLNLPGFKHYAKIVEWELGVFLYNTQLKRVDLDNLVDCIKEQVETGWEMGLSDQELGKKMVEKSSSFYACLGATEGKLSLLWYTMASWKRRRASSPEYRLTKGLPLALTRYGILCLRVSMFRYTGWK